MVSYYNTLTMYSKNPCTNLYPPPNHWYAPNYHQPPNPQLFAPDSEAQAQPMYYTHMFHQGSPDWPSHDNFQRRRIAFCTKVHPAAQVVEPQDCISVTLALAQWGREHITPDGLTSIPSPPITVSGSEMSSPGAPNGAGSPHTMSRPVPVKSPYEWMKKTSYQNQTNPGTFNAINVAFASMEKYRERRQFYSIQNGY
uniref:Putative transcription factor caudal n=1 Tax=Lutzomyia longipalpis TaxID=7200 RepID=A0A1B0CWM1_LUTLO